eukprot:CAMPEP_0194538494 /NCGR_PEP_ID=MMETSP0253-20130528/78043_1 /TAXON_ID=2966 /ORGANISM="Noctiluca scintillans" /LENGTH=105 /DNA_ID=CAMNT_0039384621 /DNA_START=80 /DNA_END=393 /DNA_ORIENTATION=-
MSNLKVVLNDIMMSAATMTLKKALAYRAVEWAMKQPATSRPPTVTWGAPDHIGALVGTRGLAATNAATAFTSVTPVIDFVTPALVAFTAAPPPVIEHDAPAPTVT